MGLKLVSCADDRALAIRDHILPLVRQRGTLEIQHGPVRVITLRIEPWTFTHWTPFSDLSSEEASSPGYRHALERQHTKPDLPYGLDVWHGIAGTQRLMGGGRGFRGGELRPRSLGGAGARVVSASLQETWHPAGRAEGLPRRRQDSRH